MQVNGWPRRVAAVARARGASLLLGARAAGERLHVVGAADVREGRRRRDRQPGRRRPASCRRSLPGSNRRLAKPDPKLPKRGVIARPDARHDHRPADRDDDAVRAPRHASGCGEPVPAVRVPAVPDRQPGRAQYLLTGTIARVPTAPLDKPHGAPQPRADRPQDRPRRRPGVGAGARGEPRQHAVALLPRQPGADQGQGRRGLRQDDADAARPARPTRTTWSGSAPRA